LIQGELIWSIDKKGVDLKCQFGCYRQDREIDDPVSLRDRSCEEVKESKVGHNLNRGFSKGMRGGCRSIAGPKVV
jgi:hypothetical protein